MSSLFYLYHLVFIGQKDTNTKTELCFSLRLCVCLPPPSLSPSCPVMCSGQTVWLLGVSGMIIETEASKDIPRCLVYPETSLAAQALLLYWQHFSCSPQRTVASCRLWCPYHCHTVSFGWNFLFTSYSQIAKSEWIVFMWSFCFRFSAWGQAFLHYLPSEVNTFVLFFVSMHMFKIYTWY